MVGAAGAANIWWWDNYVDPNNLYFHYAALSAFLKDVQLTDQWTPFTSQAFQYIGDTKPTPIAVHVNGNVASWEKVAANAPATVAIDPDGTVHAPDQLAQLLHGLGGNKDKHNPITFDVNFANAGEFVVNVTGVSGWNGAELTVAIDGKKVLDQPFEDPDGLDKKDTLHQYDKDYRVKLSAGKHKVLVENTGPDWIYASYAFIGCAQSTKPPLRCWGLTRGDSAIAWIQNAGSTWRALANKEPLTPVAATRVGIPVTIDDNTRVVLWDPWTGKELPVPAVEEKGGHKWIVLPAIERDIALKVMPAK